MTVERGTLRGWVYRDRGIPFGAQGLKPWVADVGYGGWTTPRADCELVANVGYFETRAEAIAAVEIALFDAKHRNCCHRCGWSLTSHGRSQYGLDCPWGTSPAAKAGHLRIVRLAEQRLEAAA